MRVRPEAGVQSYCRGHQRLGGGGSMVNQPSGGVPTSVWGGSHLQPVGGVHCVYDDRWTPPTHPLDQALLCWVTGWGAVSEGENSLKGPVTFLTPSPAQRSEAGELIGELIGERDVRTRNLRTSQRADPFSPRHALPRPWREGVDGSREAEETVILAPFIPRHIGTMSDGWSLRAEVTSRSREERHSQQRVCLRRAVLPGVQIQAVTCPDSALMETL
ncbi:unnamed protein product [Pleuronectes platessa]|uniref:Uncharacterized protein n=1 Tax=Pleuronectes platessa TaxID=8262 RepID=A0A9N7YFN4_PLEPL|nr:unnamed protein product [Pleuronectes platessa]